MEPCESNDCRKIPSDHLNSAEQILKGWIRFHSNFKKEKLMSHWSFWNWKYSRHWCYIKDFFTFIWRWELQKQCQKICNQRKDDKNKIKTCFFLNFLYFTDHLLDMLRTISWISRSCAGTHSTPTIRAVQFWWLGRFFGSFKL